MFNMRCVVRSCCLVFVVCFVRGWLSLVGCLFVVVSVCCGRVLYAGCLLVMLFGVGIRFVDCC